VTREGEQKRPTGGFATSGSFLLRNLFWICLVIISALVEKNQSCTNSEFYMKTQNQMKKRIMRRVYITFGIRIATHVTTLHLVVMAASVYALGYFVHVAAVFRNASAVPVGEFVSYMLRALAHADVMTMLVLGVIVLTIASLPMSLPKYRMMHTV